MKLQNDMQELYDSNHPIVIVMIGITISNSFFTIECKTENDWSQWILSIIFLWLYLTKLYIDNYFILSNGFKKKRKKRHRWSWLRKGFFLRLHFQTFTVRNEFNRLLVQKVIINFQLFINIFLPLRTISLNRRRFFFSFSSTRFFVWISFNRSQWIRPPLIFTECIEVSELSFRMIYSDWKRKEDLIIF